MGRHYRIEITPNQQTDANASATTGSGAPLAFGAQPSGNTSLPAPLNSLFPLDSTGNSNSYEVEFDLAVNSNGTNGGGARILTIYGIDPRCISQVSNLNFCNIVVYGGFDNGMPLSTLMAPLSVQPLVAGTIYGPWGNWIGTELSLSIPVISSGWTPQSRPNLVLYGNQGTPLSTAITNALTNSLPGQSFTVDISPNLVLQQDTNQGVAASLEDFADMINKESIRQLGASLPNYQGIKLGWKGSMLLVTDKTSPSSSKQVSITASQLLGNPAWVDAASFQVMCPMRSDIQLFDNITLPSTPQVTNAAFAQQQVGQQQQQLTGSYQVTDIRHLGKSRSANALDWSTIYTVSSTPVTSTNSGGAIGSSTPNISSTTGSGAPVAFGQ
jgi:hypothetical protein